MIQPMIIISLEKFGETLQFHAINDKGPSNRTTLQARLITNQDEVHSLMKSILNNGFDALVMYFQTKYKWHHQLLNFSYGPMLRNYIKEERQKN